MANFIKQAIPQLFIGSSGDSKPTSVGVGSLCYERDTEDWYITYNTGTNWILYEGELWLL